MRSHLRSNASIWSGPRLSQIACNPATSSTAANPYCLDEDFGPFFIKFSTYFPYTAKLCIRSRNS